MSESPYRVVVAGGGVAGLETLVGLRALAAGRVKLTLVAPEDEFVYRPLGVEAPFAVGRARRVSLQRAAREVDAAFLSSTVEVVDPGAKTVRLSDGRLLEYDGLVLATGAEAMPAMPNVLTWDDRADSELLGGLMQDFEQGYSRSLAIVIPPGPGWPLRGYELALFITLEAKGMGIDLQTTLVAPDPSPLGALGQRAVELIFHELELAGITTVEAPAATVEREGSTAVVLQPSGERLTVDRVLALPVLRGRSLTGIPSDSKGFVEVDEYCRVRGVDGIWAAGDGTAFDVKSGGFAAEQADVAAEAIAARAGVAIEPRRFDPARSQELAGLPAGRFLKTWLAGGDEGALTTHLPARGVPVLTYLQRDLAAGWRGYG